MYEEIAGRFIALTDNYGSLRTTVELIYNRVDGVNQGTIAPKSDLMVFAETLKKIEDQCRELGANVAADSAKFTYKNFEELEVTWDAVVRLLEHSKRTLVSEVGQWRLLVLDGKASEKYHDAQPFGAKVQSKFGSAEEDVLEAAKCLALERPGGAVMHLLRACERPLKAVATLVLTTVPTDLNTWGKYLRAIQDEVFKPLPAGTKVSPAHEFGRTVCGYIESLKRVRNSRIMHVDEPLPDMQIAQAMYDRVKALMEHIADHLDEDGTFTP